MRLRPRVPATARESMARGVILRPSTHMATGMARISRSRTAKVASGVTSRGESPVPPVVMMAAVEGDALDPTVEQRYRQALSAQAPCPDIVRIDRFAFYDRAQKAFAIVITGERAKYGNILLKKGVTP